MDIFPTLLEFAHIPQPRCDGHSLRPLLAGEDGFPGRDLFWHFPCYTGRYGPGGVIRSGNFKLIEFFESRTTELYDLAKDPGEERDLTIIDPERVTRLLEKLRAWQSATRAPLPTKANTAYDSTSERGGVRGNRAKGGRGRNKTKSSDS